MRRLILRATSFAVDLYYERRLLGEAIPMDGPLVLVANHPNGLVDPIVVSSATPRPIRLLGKAPLFRMPLLGWLMRRLRVLPVYRASDGADTALNRRTFDAAFDALADGDVICIFPEGKSHSEPALQDLKTGAARMALGAEARADFGLNVRIVPIGLVYRAKRRFGSQVATWIGAPIGLRDLADLHAEDEFASVRRLTERIADGLKQVTIELDQWEDLRLFEFGQRILHPSERPSLSRLQAFATGARSLRSRDATRLDQLAARAMAFSERLARLGMSIEDLEVRYRPGRVAWFLLENAVVFALTAPAALVGILFWVLPYRLIPIVTGLVRPTRDIHATVQILGGMVIFPLWLLVASGLALAQFGWIYAVSVLVLLPPLGALALVALRWAAERSSDISVFLRTGLRAGLRACLKVERDELGREIEALARDLDAAEERIGGSEESSP